MELILNLCYVMLGLCLVMIVRNEVTYHNRELISNAIFKYHCDCFEKHRPILVTYLDRENYNATLFRIWDFGYTRILPKEKFEIIREFIEE